MSTDRCTITLRDPGDVIAAIPSLLGFVPRRSLVVICFAHVGGRVQVTMRHDIDLDADGSPTPHMLSVLDHLARVATRDRIGAAIAVVVDDRASVDDPRWAHLLGEVGASLSSCGPIAAFAVGELVADAVWWSVCGHHESQGVLPDPRSTPMAIAHAVVSGRRVAATREEMRDALRPGPHCADHPNSRRLPTVGRQRMWHGADDHAGDPGAVSSPPAQDAAHLRRVVDAVRTGPPTDCASVTALGAALESTRVRDALLALATSEAADAAETLWEDLTRRLRGSQRAAAATLLAHASYVRGSGALAGLALDAALAAAPDYGLATLLDRALRAGMPPASLSDLAVTSRAIAHDLGVPLPAEDARLTRAVCEPSAPDHPRSA